MNKKTKQLLKQNNLLEKQLDKSDDIIMTNIVVYLRGSDINEYNQELVRRDILQMLIEAAKRGDDIEKVIGGDYKTFCDEIISVLPKKSGKEKMLDYIDIALMGLIILGTILFIEQLVLIIMKKQSEWLFTVTYGDIIKAAVIIAIAVILVDRVCKTAFDNKKPKKAQFLIVWIILTAIFIGLFFISSRVTAVCFSMPMIAAAAALLILFALKRCLNNIIF